MNMFARLSHLEAMRAAIVTETLKLGVSFPKPGTNAENELLAKVDRWQETIRAMEKDIKSRSNFNHMIARQNRSGPGAYSAQQSLASKEKNLSTLRRNLFEVAGALTDLLARFYGGPSEEQRGLEGLKHALKRLGDSAAQGEEVTFDLGREEFTFQAEIRALQDTLPPEAPRPANPGAIVDVFTLIMAYFVLLKAARKKT